MLPKEKSDKCILIMHTTPVDNNGTDLYAVVDKICPDYRVELLGTKVEADLLNQLYNVADCTINIANNEGFGLTTAESIMAGTPIIVNVTGGLQDQCGFEYTADDYIKIESLHQADNNINYGEWVQPVWPSAININGSPLTPYIFDDRVNDYDVANAIFVFYNLGRELRKEKGLKGREWALNNLSSKIMCDALINGIETTFENFQPRKKYDLYKIV
jgi:glycosyltransferase involved in cell wall biosynthesis